MKIRPVFLLNRRNPPGAAPAALVSDDIQPWHSQSQPARYRFEGFGPLAGHPCRRLPCWRSLRCLGMDSPRQSARTLSRLFGIFLQTEGELMSYAPLIAWKKFAPADLNS